MPQKEVPEAGDNQLASCGLSLSMRVAVLVKGDAHRPLYHHHRSCDNTVFRVKIGASFSSSSRSSTAPPGQLRVQAQAFEVAVPQDLTKSTQLKQKLPVVNSHKQMEFGGGGDRGHSTGRCLISPSAHRREESCGKAVLGHACSTPPR